MLRSDRFLEFGVTVIELQERCADALAVRYCAVCWTEFSWALNNPTRVEVIDPGMKPSMDWPT